MGHVDLFKYALRGMLGRQTQSYLTILGVVIGIASIVSIVSIGQGISSYVQDELMTFGTDYISVTPGKLTALSGQGPVGITRYTLDNNDFKIISSAPGVKKAYGQIMAQAPVEFAGENGAVLVIGFTSGGLVDFPVYKLREGRDYKPSSGEAIIGAGLADDFFKRKVKLGDSLKLNNASFKVVGILEKGSGLTSIIDSVVLTDTGDMYKITGRAKALSNYDEIDAKLLPGADPDGVAETVAERLRNAHHVTKDNEDFTILTPQATSDLVGGILGTLNLFLGGLAGIALVVGGVGIMNTMFMAVTERTREIGVLKAIGGRDSDILEIFILESGMIGLLGGIIGVSIGFALSFAISLLGVPSTVDVSLVSWALAFSFVIGIVSGFIPARVAANLPPVEALRYE
jgi:putative ABC transport system permease protein